MLQIRGYKEEDKARCLELFQSNLPKYFASHELALFDKFLDTSNPKEYFVAENENIILACGGVFLDKRFGKANLSWGMVHSDYHGKGIGRKFTQFRVEKMKEIYPERGAMLETSQFTFPFYEKMGFVTKKISPGGFGAGFDKYYMEKE